MSPQVEFSLAGDGPLFRLYRRARPSGSAFELQGRRLIVIPAIAWLPLLLLAALQGHVLRGVQVPFLLAIETHVRFLVVLPLLLAAEIYVHDWSRGIVRQFLGRGVIAPEDRARFDGIMTSTLRWRDSIGLELVLAALAFMGHWATLALSLDVSAWYGVWVDGHLRLEPAGYWAAWISLPILRFMILRWYFRLFLWYRLLWQVARLPLRLNTLHPDRAGGLGFLAESILAFAPVLMAQSAFVAGAIGNRIWRAGAHLPDFKIEILAFLIFLLLLVLAPLTFFSAKLLSAKLTMLERYGDVAGNYVRAFHEKWIEDRNPEKDRLLGTGDIQSLADLSNSLVVARETRLVPFGKQDVLLLAGMVAAPMVPLLLFVVPLDEILERIAGLVL